MAPDDGFDVATQTSQNIELGGSNAQEIEARLQQILESMRVNPPADDDGSEVDPEPGPSAISSAANDADPDQNTIGFPPFMRLPSQNHSVTRLGQAMVDRGLITQDDLERALDHQRTTRKRLGEALIDIGAVTSFQLSQALADHLGVPFVDLETHPPDILLAGMIPEEVARRYCALPVERWSGQVVVAMANPNDVFALDDIRVLTGQSILAALADTGHLLAAIEHAYSRSDLIESSLDDAADDYDVEAEIGGKGALVDDAPVVKLVHALLEKAVADRASDLHIEPASRSVMIRMRIDGILHDTSEAPLNVLRPMVSRLKVMGSLDIAQNRLPQDGRFSLSVQGRPIDVRIATVPTAAGESVVLRLLDPVRGAMDLASLGLSPYESERFVSAFHAPQGAIFVTGPTGSGKSSTLYALISSVNTRDKSIVSVEDPVEYRLDGVKQIQINARAGMTFPSALRSTLRADPDVILVGEVRDAETARIAADASITGHLVLSTLHATRSAAAPIRLIDMGVEPYLVASAVSCIAAQRLARKLCDTCATPIEPDMELLRRLGATDAILAEGINLRSPRGCANCRKTGYRGRAPIFEIMPVTEDITRLIVEKAPSADIERVAVEQGMDTLRVAALRRVL
ncbi:MAG TPA: GspE/PulE family protein, partial [Acidimicrobiia bacterium]|nr:GspE/PulE family protein [Acidimicrobiia bacterium]